MNIEVSHVIYEAIHAASPIDWKNFFEDIRNSEYQKLATHPRDELTNLQERIKLIDELEHFFVSTRESKPAKP